MTAQASKETYAQSSDIRARSYRQYRHDMKRKAIAELEFRPFLERTLSGLHPGAAPTVTKHGGDAALWFARDGRISQAPDYRAAYADGQSFLYEFQYAEETDKLEFFDFKVSKVGRKPRNSGRIAHTGREFFYVLKPERKYAFLTPQWIMDNGRVAAVPAWGSRTAYRVPRGVFLRQFVSGGDDLAQTIQAVDAKNLLLDFQSELLDLEAQEFSRQLQQVVDEEKLLAIVPGTFESFYRVCYLLDRIQKAPDNPGVWLVYLASYFNPDMPALDLARFMFSLDFLYFKCAALQPNELRVVHKLIADAGAYVKGRAGQANGSLAIDPRVAPLEETRQILFAVNLLEDIQQDARVSLGMDLPAITAIFETLPDASKTAGFIAGSQRP